VGIVVNACRTYPLFQEKHGGVEIAACWDALSGEQQQTFFNDYFSIDRNAFFKWQSDLHNRQVEDPSIRQTEQYTADMEAFAAANGGGAPVKFGAHGNPWEYGDLGAELRHWDEFYLLVRGMCWEELNEKYSLQDIDDPTKPMPVSKEELGDSECPICYSTYSMIDGSDPNEEVNPVKIACGHTFCSECHQRCLDSAAATAALSCPMCRVQFVWEEIPELCWSVHVENMFIVKRDDEGVYYHRSGTIQELAEMLLRGIDLYMGRLPQEVFDDAQFSITNNILEELADHVFGPTDQLLPWVHKVETTSSLPSHRMDYHLGVAAILALRNRLEAYLQGDAERYRYEVKRGLQLQALVQVSATIRSVNSFASHLLAD
jgi:hypothetical protein